MKLQIFFSLTIIFICVYITFVPFNEAWPVAVSKDLLQYTRCRIWITDKYGNRIDSSGYGEYHYCDDGAKFMDVPNNWYWIHVKVQASFLKEKVRGPLNKAVSFSISGDVDDWSFNEVTD